MRHHTCLSDDANHWAIGHTGARMFEDDQAFVLVQVQEQGVQSRIRLTVEETRAMAQALLQAAQTVEDANEASSATSLTREQCQSSNSANSE